MSSPIPGTHTLRGKWKLWQHERCDGDSQRRGWQEWSLPSTSYIRVQQANTHDNILRSLWLEDRATWSSVTGWTSLGSCLQKISEVWRGQHPLIFPSALTMVDITEAEHWVYHVPNKEQQKPKVQKASCLDLWDPAAFPMSSYCLVSLPDSMSPFT